MKLSVIIPTYNERQRLPETLKSVDEYLFKNKIDSEIIISDDGSTDGTLEYVKSVKTKTSLKLVGDKIRQGKGAGVKRGILASSGDYAIFTDADNSTEMKEIEKFWPLAKEYDVIIGSRYAGIKQEKEQSFLRRLVSRGGSNLIKLFTGLDFKDTQCGFKMFSRAAAKKIFPALQDKGWGFDVEVLLLARKFGFKTKEIAVRWRDAEGSHLKSGTDSIKTFFEILKIARRVKARR